MAFPLEKLENYFHSVTGLDLCSKTAASEVVSGLPLYIRERYQWRCARIYGHEFLFALEKTSGGEASRPTPGDFVRQAEVIREKLAREVVFVIHPVPSFVRNRLVHSHVSFIVPGSQMFLPDIPLDLREYFPRRKISYSGKLLASAQVIILYQLIRGGLECLSQREIAKEIFYSAMMVSHARDQLESHGLCEVEKHGRSVNLHFPLSRRELWEQSKKLMSSPVRKTHWITGRIKNDLCSIAGVSALSQRSMLGKDTIPTIAIYYKDFSELVDKGWVHDCPMQEEAGVQVEAWRYDPRLLTDREGLVDVYSLYLSLEESPDERIQQELNKMMEKIQW